MSLAERMTSDDTSVSGSLRVLLLFDIAEEIDVAQIHGMVGTSPARREPAFRLPAPDYVKFERTPVVEYLPNCQSSRGEELQTRIRYFDYGVASVEFQVPFRWSWNELVRNANRWILSSGLEGTANSLLRDRLQHFRPALKKSYEAWISEDYYVIHVDPIRADDERVLGAEELLAERGMEIAQIVRGEESALSRGELQDVLQSSMSYYPTDLLVVGWIAAFVYDTPSGAASTLDLLEYANTQLLEFRYYDDVLTHVLTGVYKRLETRRRRWARWTLAREAENLNTLRLDYRELSERTENAIKFLGDMFYARAYRLAAARIGVSDYRNLVTEKLNTARDLYESMVNEFNEGRAFFLESMVVIILIIEIVFLFRGKF